MGLLERSIIDARLTIDDRRKMGELSKGGGDILARARRELHACAGVRDRIQCSGSDSGTYSLTPEEHRRLIPALAAESQWQRIVRAFAAAEEDPDAE